MLFKRKNSQAIAGPRAPAPRIIAHAKNFMNFELTEVN